MKTIDPRDRLDQKIDQLFAEQPVTPSSNFVARTLAELDAKPRSKKPSHFAPLIRFALPLAAVLALAFVAFNQFNLVAPETPAPANDLAAMNPALGEQDLSRYEIQELLMLQEGLSGFTQVESEALSNSEDLLITLETLYSI